MSATGEVRQGAEGFRGDSQTIAKSHPWYRENIQISDEGREILEQWGGVAPEQVQAHVEGVREKAFAIWAYPCIGEGHFLNSAIYQSPYLERVLGILAAGGKLLDAGCCFGQELRFLRQRDGIPGVQLFGFDLEPGFIDIGYELFRDREKLAATLTSGDLMADRDAPVNRGVTAFEGRMDVVNVSLVLHVFDLPNMVTAAKRLVSFTKPRAGSTIVGYQLGSTSPGEYPMPTGKGHGYRHDEASMERFWKQVGVETNTEWRIESKLVSHEAIERNRDGGWAKDDPLGMRIIWFAATRI